MKFRNAKVPEGINVSRHNPLTDLLILSAGAAGVFLLLMVGLWYFGGVLARYMPMQWENALANAAVGDTFAPEDEAGRAIQAELQSLADRLSGEMALHPDLRVRVHYIDSDVLNAGAWLGGHVFMYRGLLQRLPNENALAMVLAHEIAHAGNRDAVAHMGGGLLLQLSIAVAFGGVPPSLEQLLHGSNALILLSFSRDAERQADDAALGAVAGTYGHVAGASALFEVFLEEAARRNLSVQEFFSSHPLSEDRIDRVAQSARQRGWPLEGTLTPLSPVLSDLLVSD